MPGIDTFMDRIARIIHNKSTGKIWFSKLDLNYAFGQMKLSKETADQCIFSILGGEMTGQWKMKRGFYGFCDIPNLLQQQIESCLQGINNAFPFLDDVLIVSKGDKEQHKEAVKLVVSKMAERGFSIAKKVRINSSRS